MTKGTTSARLSSGQQYEAGSPMHVLISPDDDRRAGACAPLTPGVRQPVAASTDSGDASNGEHSGGEIPHQRDFRAYPSDRDRFRLRRIAVR
jgi:hypothetical protein